jgi:hypothetical protein
VLNVKPEEVNAALREAYMEPGVFIGPYNPIVLNTGTRLVLIDMGTGEANYIATKGVAGQLLTNTPMRRRQARCGVTEWSWDSSRVCKSPPQPAGANRDLAPSLTSPCMPGEARNLGARGANSR